MRTKIHITRITAYLFQLFVVIACYSVLKNHFFLILLVLLGLVVPLSFVGVFILRRSVELKVSAPQKDCIRNSIGYLKLSVTNRSFVTSLEMKVRLAAENSFYGDKNYSEIVIPVKARGTFEKLIPIEYSMNGLYTFSIEGVHMRDLLGIISLYKPIDESTDVVVVPDAYMGRKFDMSDMSRGMTESEETIKKGHDFTDVSDVREYIPGDKLMSIHWKLSAKKDQLMVKDRVSMSDQQLVVVAELAGTPEEVDEILTLTYGICRSFVADQTFVRLMWWSEASYEFRERSIMNNDDINECFADIYYEKLYKNSDKTRELMVSIHPELKAYIDICMHNGEADAVVVEN